MILPRHELKEELIENGVRDQENELKRLLIKDGIMLNVIAFSIVKKYLTIVIKCASIWYLENTTATYGWLFCYE